MPREQRRPSQAYRHDPIHPATEEPYSHRSCGKWPAGWDEILIAARASGMNWQPIADTHFPGEKSGNACRKRHERLMEKQRAEDWDEEKLDRLAVEYMAVRSEMWSVLASRMGEKWQNVEAKCMEKGIKNLTAAYKSALQRNRHRDRAGMPQMPRHQHCPYPSSVCPQQENDSGSSDTDAEYEVDYAAPAMPRMTAPITNPPIMTPPVSGMMPGEAAGYATANSYMQPRRRMSYQPIMMQQPMVPHHVHSMVPPHMLPVSQGQHISVHSMLSPSPPGDDEGE